MKLIPGFTTRYTTVNKLRRNFPREGRSKAARGKKKMDLVDGMNPQWLDLYETL